jgi:phosphoglycolate phosphatase-like HAD superfamily hydrolase
LDGTLLDVRQKYHKIYEAGLTARIDPFVFWDLKRSGACDDEICKILRIDVDLAGFKQYKRDNIETWDFLKFDRLIDGVENKLARLSLKRPLCILTVRKNRDNLIEQLHSLGIARYFDNILSPRAEMFELPGCEQKIALLAESYPCVSGVMIGDSEADVSCAREADLLMFSVLSGLRNFAYLKNLQPDNIILDFTQFSISAV